MAHAEGLHPAAAGVSSISDRFDKIRIRVLNDK